MASVRRVDSLKGMRWLSPRRHVLRAPGAFSCPKCRAEVDGGGHYWYFSRPTAVLRSRWRKMNQTTRNPNHRLRRMRRDQGLSRRTLAIMSGITEKTIRQIEEGITREPRARTVCVIAKALECEVADIDV